MFQSFLFYRVLLLWPGLRACVGFPWKLGLGSQGRDMGVDSPGPDLALSPILPQTSAQVLSSDREAGAGKGPEGFPGDPGLCQQISQATWGNT